MPSIIIRQFGGIRPAVKPDAGDTSQASIARNVNIEHGDLRAWRYPGIVTETPHTKVCSIYKHECCFIVSENPCASFAPSEAGCRRVFATGIHDWPSYARVNDPGENCCSELCELTWCRLGVPAPVNPITIVASQPPAAPLPGPVTTSDYDCTAEGNYKVQDYLGEVEYLNDPTNEDGEYVYAGPDDFCENVGLAANTDPWSLDAGLQLKKEPRSYVYTYVNEFGEESAPSPLIQPVDIDLQGIATLGFNIPPITGGFCDPIYIRIYRILPSHDKLPTISDQQTNEIGVLSGDNITSFIDSVDSAAFLVQEIPFRSGAFQIIDNPNVHLISEQLSTWENEVPRSDLKGIKMLENGSLVAFEGKNLWFSQPWQFHNWNCAMNLDDCILAIEVINGNIYVATDGYPYVISEQPAKVEDCSCCRSVVKISEPAPILSGCSMTKTNNGVMWATSTGLARLNGNGLQIVTHSYLREEDWMEWHPHQIKGVFYKGKYFGFNNKRGFIFDVTDGPYTSGYEAESGKFTELDLTPEAVYKSEDNKLYMSFDGQIHEWNISDTYMPYVWRSKMNVEGGLKNFSAMKVVFTRWLRTRRSPTPVTIRLYADGRLMFERKTNCSRPFRLPKGFDALNFHIEIEGIEQINEIHMATSMNELVALNNS